ncbi:4227_t:CDS:10 [Cetraspora pellucida]|uniref:4227_t:CDS:1 n=1 Tax=Cetraspora pellucida TaxID=1433469 RepID=A0ACA9LXP0_9GLOM|nr:4227_t:CDS:10 [Cetraspora pellucida]
MSLPESQSWKKIRLNSGKAVNAESKDTDQVDSVTIDKDEQIDSSENAELNEQVVSSWKIQEQDVGLTEYVDASIPGFSAIIKQRYSDFLVYEIDQDENIVHITNTDLPKDNNVDKQSSKTSNDDITVISTDQIFLDMKSLLGDEITEKVKTLLNTEGRDPSFVDTKPEKDKDKRTIIHQFFKKHFGDKLNTETKEGAIRISMHTSKTRNDRRNKKREFDQWEALGGPFCRFVLYKENRDTMEAINLLCKRMKVHSRVFSYAGTKDRRAITVQKVTASMIKAERLLGLNARLHDMKLGNFEYVKEGLKLGDLRGNHFVITLRNVQVESEEIIDKAMNVLKERGFINYYGMQRFGTSSISTYEIGRALLQNNWEYAVDLILKPRTIIDSKDQQQARQHWAENHDAKKALELFPKRCVAECHILSSFVKTGHNKDCAGALISMPRNLRLMYVHAYQSYIWNKMVSERLRIFGCEKPIVGDLVILDDDELGDNIADSDVTINSEDKKEIKVKILKEEDIPNYTIYDVVLPLPGYLVVYPNNNIFEKYKELMWKDHLDPREMKRNIKDFSLSGTYRKIIGKPIDVSWKTLRYDDPNIPLSLNDLDIINGKMEPENIPDGKLLALRIHISLSTSQYATMALRELLKTSILES